MNRIPGSLFVLALVVGALACGKPKPPPAALPPPGVLRAIGDSGNWRVLIGSSQQRGAAFLPAVGLRNVYLQVTSDDRLVGVVAHALERALEPSDADPDSRRDKPPPAWGPVRRLPAGTIAQPDGPSAFITLHASNVKITDGPAGPGEPVKVLTGSFAVYLAGNYLEPRVFSGLDWHLLLQRFTYASELPLDFTLKWKTPADEETPSDDDARVSVGDVIAGWVVPMVKEWLNGRATVPVLPRVPPSLAGGPETDAVTPLLEAAGARRLSRYPAPGCTHSLWELDADTANQVVAQLESLGWSGLASDYRHESGNVVVREPGEKDWVRGFVAPGTFVLEHTSVRPLDQWRAGLRRSFDAREVPSGLMLHLLPRPVPGDSLWLDMIEDVREREGECLYPLWLLGNLRHGNAHPDARMPAWLLATMGETRFATAAQVKDIRRKIREEWGIDQPDLAAVRKAALTLGYLTLDDSGSAPFEMAKDGRPTMVIVGDDSSTTLAIVRLACKKAPNRADWLDVAVYDFSAIPDGLFMSSSNQVRLGNPTDVHFLADESVIQVGFKSLDGEIGSARVVWRPKR